MEAQGGFTLDALHLATRLSGRLSLIAFSVVLLTRGTSSAAGWVSEKPFLLFATLHGIHLVELLGYVIWSGVELIPLRVLGGFVAYAFIFTMPIIVSKVNQTSLRKIEVAYLGYVWLILFLTYLPRVLGKLPNVGGTFREHLTFFVLVIFVGLTRIVMVLRTKAIA